MYADGFLNQRQRHPYAMGAAIALNLAGVAAVMLARNHYVPKQPNGPLVVETYPVLPPPPPNPDPPKPRTQTPPTAAPSPIPPPPPPPVDTSTSQTTTSAWPDTGGSIDLPPVKPTPTPTPSATPEPVLTGPIQIGTDAQPAYPPSLQRQGVEGVVVVRVLIGTDGRVKQVEIVSSDDPAFADATERQALRKWRFRPATRDGVPVESWKKLTVRFQLRR